MNLRIFKKVDGSEVLQFSREDTGVDFRKRDVWYDVPVISEEDEIKARHLEDYSYKMGVEAATTGCNTCNTGKCLFTSVGFVLSEWIRGYRDAMSKAGRGDLVRLFEIRDTGGYVVKEGEQEIYRDTELPSFVRFEGPRAVEEEKRGKVNGYATNNTTKSGLNGATFSIKMEHENATPFNEGDVIYHEALQEIKLSVKARTKIDFKEYYYDVCLWSTDQNAYFPASDFMTGYFLEYTGHIQKKPEGNFVNYIDNAPHQGFNGTFFIIEIAGENFDLNDLICHEDLPQIKLQITHISPGTSQKRKSMFYSVRIHEGGDFFPAEYYKYGNFIKTIL